jgi:hypothetical protein
VRRIDDDIQAPEADGRIVSQREASKALEVAPPAG